MIQPVHIHYLLLSVLLLLTACSAPRMEAPPGTVEQKIMGDEGSLQEHYFEKPQSDGEPLKHGPYRRWYTSGALEVRGQFEHGLKHGYWVYYDVNGRKEKTIVFDKGEPIRQFMPSPTAHDPWHHHRFHHRHHDPFHHW